MAIVLTCLPWLRKFLTGHITVGGSVCMEALTPKGWVPTNDIESILVQVRAAICSDDKARLDSTGRPYDASEAQRAFDRMCAKYGWN